MARWPFTRASERPVGIDQPAAAALTGAFAWPADPFFRPTVGVFVDGVPCAVVPTHRVRIATADGHPADWRCGFSIDRALLPAGRQGLDLRCMETGERVGMEPAGAGDDRAVLGIDALIALSEGRGVPLDPAGFAAFLALSALDQVSLVYHGILGRGPDPTGGERHLAALRRGSLTILGIRDELLRSDEFRNQRMPLLSTPFGHWIVWVGLADVAGHLVALPGHGGAAPAPDAAILARLALGETADAAALAAWTRDHAAAIAAVVDRPRAPARPTVPSPRPMSLGHPLGAMRTGEAGHRDKARITIRPRRAGSVLFGPYGRLPPGRYRLRLDLDVAPATGGEAGLLVLEVVHGDILFGLATLWVAEARAEAVTLEITVPAGLPVLSTALFEYRLATDGRVRGTVRDLAVRRLGRTGREAPAAPSAADWLPLLTVGSSASRVEGTIEAPAAASGHIFYGPHRALLPGAYLLIAHLVSAAPGSSVTMDVVDGALKPLALRKTVLAGGPQSLALAFEVPAPRDAADPPPPLEFRLHKPAGPSLTVTSLTVERTEHAPPSAG